MNPAKEHLDKIIADHKKQAQNAEDRRRRKQDVRFQRIGLVLSGVAVLISLISLAITIWQLC